ncbi:hypothetical protein CHRY9393_00558 [Chryseobacterium fistulae]|uniref:Uncharacterized protein n=1 Tax=Chryseobacterium fistulae TaxID=2675058 RepID=A0A6N4XQ52_9FLAO|nr:hypothetical protein CHRY9393_00558 [Chryseobacterium fistulae]
MRLKFVKDDIRLAMINLLFSQFSIISFFFLLICMIKQLIDDIIEN